MANSRSATKRARQAETRRERNQSNRTLMRSAIKKVLHAIASNDKAQAEAAFRVAEPIVGRMANRGIIHRNTAARYKRRLSSRIRALG